MSFQPPYFMDPFVVFLSPVAFFAKEVNHRLAKRPLVFNGRLAKRGLTSLVKDATEGFQWNLGK